MKKILFQAFFDEIQEEFVKESKDSLKTVLAKQMNIRKLEVEIRAEIANKSGKFTLCFGNMEMSFKQGEKMNFNLRFDISDKVLSYKKTNVL